jgi:hypothetical protein
MQWYSFAVIDAELIKKHAVVKHSYVTGLAFSFGLYAYGLQGVLIGPLLVFFYILIFRMLREGVQVVEEQQHQNQTVAQQQQQPVAAIVHAKTTTKKMGRKSPDDEDNGSYMASRARGASTSVRRHKRQPHPFQCYTGGRPKTTRYPP